MSDWPQGGGHVRNTVFAPQAEVLAYLMVCNYTGAGAAPGQNVATYVPVTIEKPTTVTQISYNVTTQSGNVDVGIFDEARVQLVSSGATAVAAAGIQTVNITDTLLDPGAYFVGISFSSATAACTRLAAATQVMKAGGIQQESSAHPLPSTFTALTTPVVTFVPLLALTTRTTL